MSPLRGRAPLLAMVALLALGCAFATFHQRDWGFDAAYVAYRYALNLVEGHGLVWNPGEPVEGYSSLLYVLLVAPGIALFGADSAYAWSVAVNVLLLLAALVGVDAAARAELPRNRALGVDLLFAASPVIWLAAASGLETALVLALFALAWAMLARIGADRGPDASRSAPALRWLAAALAGLVLARADGFVMAALFLVYLAARRLPAAPPRAVAVCAAAAAGAALAQVAGRLLYYGSALPNGYYAAITGSLADRLEFAWALLPELHAIHPHLAIVTLAAAAALVAVPARWRAEGWRGAAASLPFEVFFALAWLGYWFAIGGDVFGERFVLVLIPLGAHTLFAHARRLAAARPRLEAWLAVPAAALLLAAPWWSADFFSRRTTYDPGLALGDYLRERHPHAHVAVDAPGKIPFGSRLAAIDMSGRNDAAIARAAREFDLPGGGADPYDVLDRKPDLVTGWFNPLDLAVEPGFQRSLYTEAGYEIRYLVFAAAGRPPEPGTPAVVRVERLTQPELRELYQRGYRYAVLAAVRGLPRPGSDQ